VHFIVAARKTKNLEKERGMERESLNVYRFWIKRETVERVAVGKCDCDAIVSAALGVDFLSGILESDFRLNPEHTRCMHNFVIVRYVFPRKQNMKCVFTHNIDEEKTKKQQ
jgi:hypothetical protein